MERMLLFCPWKKPSMAFFHSIDRRKRRGFPGSMAFASCCPWKKPSMAFFHSIDRRKRRGFPGSMQVFLVMLGVVAGASVRAEDLAGRLGAFGGPAADPLAAVNAALGSPVTITAAVEPGTADKPDVLAVTATLEEGWHLYSVTQKSGGPRPTRIVLAADSARSLAGAFVPDAAPTSHEAEDVPAWKGLVIEEHAGTVTWRAPLAPGAAGEVQGTVSLQLCRDNSCLPPETLPFTATVAAGAAAGNATAAGAVATHVPDRTHARVEVTAEPGRAVAIRLVPEEDWHLYAPSSTGSSGIGQGKPTIVSLGAATTARVAAVEARDVERATSAELAAAGAVEGPVALDVRLEPAAREGVVEAVLGFQTCSGDSCDPPTGLRVTARLGAGPAAVEFAEARYAEAAQAPATISAPNRSDAASSPRVAATADAAATPSSKASLSLPTALLYGLLGGLILNLMPCVLPVLGLKLMSFAQQSGRARQEVFAMNLWYCAGVFAVFFALATASVAANLGLAGSNLGWGQQFQFVEFRIAMIGIVFAFALSFLGVWEIPIPGFIGEQAGHVQTKEGPAGSFLKGVLGTVLATPCSGPFLGPVFGFTLTQPTAVTYAVFAAIATGMALPYILVGLFPSLVRFMPRPGAWMATFKELLGFVMLGTVAYLFYMLRQQPAWFVPTFVMLIGLWMGCWWVGRLQERQGVVGFGRWLQAATIATAIGTAGFYWLGPHAGGHGQLIDWQQPFSVQQLATHRMGGATVLVDFTADWCPTCKTNLATAIETTKVADTIRKNNVVPILADFTDRSPEIDRFLASMGSRSIPFLVIFPGSEPGKPLRDPIVLRDAITESQLLAALEQAGPSCCPPPTIRAAQLP
jgi:thiol:disulfide interchange protein